GPRDVHRVLQLDRRFHGAGELTSAPAPQSAAAGPAPDIASGAGPAERARGRSRPFTCPLVVALAAVGGRVAPSLSGGQSATSAPWTARRCASSRASPAR